MAPSGSESICIAPAGLVVGVTVAAGKGVAVALGKVVAVAVFSTISTGRIVVRGWFSSAVLGDWQAPNSKKPEKHKKSF
jgi:hypothetical protein